jgi:hypothetical protein
LPDGIFSNPKAHFGKILESLIMEGVRIFYGHLAYFKVNWKILWPFGTFCINLVFSPFWYVVPRKIWQPCSQRKEEEDVWFWGYIHFPNAHYIPTIKVQKILERRKRHNIQFVYFHSATSVLTCNCLPATVFDV